METTGLIDAFRRWLPYPVYRFVGGPFDGQDLPVKLYKTDRGMMAPEVWDLCEPPSPPPEGLGASPISVDEKIAVHRYRFMPQSMNEGHYRYLD